MAKKDDVEPDATDEQYAGDEGGEAGGGEEYDTEGLPGGRIPNPPPRDPWVSRVVDDPSNPPDAVLLSGYVGDAAEEGRSRIYTDASLSSYVEVSDEDVLHHEPARGDAVPEGGSLVWVRSDALVTPGPSGGTGSGGAAGGDFFTGPVLAQNRKPGTGTGTGAGEAIGPVQITLLTIAGCYTQRFGCTIFTCPTRNFLCRTVHPIICSYVCQQGGGIDLPGGGLQGVRDAAAGGGEGQDQPVGPTGYFHCGELVGNTGRYGCLEGQHQVSLPGCIQTGVCGGREGTDTVQAAAGGTIIGRTGWQGCGQPTHLIGCTGWQGCGQPHISLPGCIHTGTCSAVDACPTRLCAPGAGTDTVAAAGGTIIGRTGWQGCGQPSHLIGCTGWQGCGQPHISLPGCIHTGTCPQVSLPGCVHTGTCPSAVDACPTRICGGGGGEQVNPQPLAAAALGAGAAAPTTQYAPQCPTFGFTCTYVHCPPRSVATVCTQLGCQTQHCTMPPGCPPPTGPNNTLATVCTQINCPSFGFTCTVFCQAQGGGGAEAGPGNTTATVCTQIGCPHISLPGCVHTGTCAPRGGADTVQAAALAGPGSTTATVCTQLCHTGHIVCPPTHEANCSMATVCTQIGCHTAPQHCIPTIPPLCPPHTGPNGTVATVCTQIGCPHISLPGCVHTGTCAPGGGTDTVQAAGLAGPGNTTATVCTQIGCPPHTGHANCSMATVCTQIGCHTAPQHCIPTLPVCPPHTLGVCTQIGCETFGFTCTVFCQAQGGGTDTVQAAGAQAAAAPTGQYAPTVCTQIGCPSVGYYCTVFCQAQGGGADTVQAAGVAGPGITAATVCTQIGCPPHQPGLLGAAGPGHTAATVCTQIGCHTFGFTCTAFCQGAGGGLPGGMGGGGGTGGGGQGQATAATVCTQGGCIPRTRICPPTFQPGCGPDHEHGGSTAATLCTLAPFCPPTAHCPGQTVATLCTQIGCQPHTGLGCPRTSTCPPTQTPGCGGGRGLRAEAPAAAGMAAPTTIYGPQCPTFGFTCTYVHCPPPVTVGLGCPPTSTCPPVTLGLGCPSTSTCPPVTMGLGCPSTSTCPPVTVRLGCPSTSTCPPVTMGLGCPSTSTCPPQSMPFGCPVSATCPPPTGVCPPA